MAIATKVKYMTDIAECMYPHLNEPDTKFNKDGEYNVSLILDDDTAIIPEIKKMLKSNFGEPTKKPFQVPFDRDEESGKIVLRLKTSYAPYFFDSRGKMIKPSDLPKILSGSRLKIGGMMTAYDVNGNKGVSVKIGKVQIVELAEPQSDFEDLGSGYMAEPTVEVDLKQVWDEDDSDF